MRAPWRGNVRELRNFADRLRALGAEQALSRLAIFGPSPNSDAPVEVGLHLSAPPAAVPLSMLPPPAEGAVPHLSPELFEGSYKEFRERWIDLGEREYVQRLLKHHRSVAAASREAGLDRTYLYRLIRKHDL